MKGYYITIFFNFWSKEAPLLWTWKEYINMSLIICSNNSSIIDLCNSKKYKSIFGMQLDPECFSLKMFIIDGPEMPLRVSDARIYYDPMASERNVKHLRLWGIWPIIRPEDQALIILIRKFPWQGFSSFFAKIWQKMKKNLLMKIYGWVIHKVLMDP